jgi:hypothetical protein
MKTRNIHSFPGNLSVPRAGIGCSSVGALKAIGSGTNRIFEIPEARMIKAPMASKKKKIALWLMWRNMLN